MTGSDADDGLGAGAIVGIVVGMLAGIAIAVGVGYFIGKKKGVSKPKQNGIVLTGMTSTVTKASSSIAAAGDKM